MRPVLNRWLKWIEKPFLAREKDPLVLRRGFERKARLFFHAPWGTRVRRDRLADVPVLWINESASGPLILYLHGGAFVMGSPDTHKAMMGYLSRASDLPVCLPHYRLAPEHLFPAATDDVLACYKAVMDHSGGVVLGGDSAGGGLALALLAQIQQLGLPKPLGAFAFSPLTDLAFTGASVRRNADADVMLPVSRARDTVTFYLGDHDPRDPRASPLYADFRGVGPVWMTAGDTEILLDDTRRMAMRMQDQGVTVTPVIERNLPHAWPLFHNTLPEARQTLMAVAQWINSLSPTKADN